MVILYNKVVQNYHKNYPKKGVKENLPKSVVTENG